MEKRGFWVVVVVILGFVLFAPTIDNVSGMFFKSLFSGSPSYQTSGMVDNANKEIRGTAVCIPGQLDGPCEITEGVCDGQRKVCRSNGQYPSVCDETDYGHNNFGYEHLIELTCNDTLDNDCDGLTDMGDPDCQGPPLGNVELLDEFGFPIASFDTIQECADVIVAGQTCLVYPGIYDERIEFSNGHSGAPNNKVTFKASSKGAAEMRGFNTRRVDYLRIEGFNITNKYQDWDTKQGIFLRSDYVEIVDNYFYNLTSSAIYGYDDANPIGANIADNKMYMCSKGFSIEGENWVVENNEVERNYDWSLQGYMSEDTDFARFFGKNHVIRNNYFHGTKLEEVGTSHVDCFQTWGNHTTNPKIVINITIENNVCLGFFHQAIIARDYIDFPSLSMFDFTIKNNIFAHGTAWGILMDSANNVEIYNNVIADIGHHGIRFRNQGNGVVKNNILYNLGDSYEIENGGVVEGDYNLIYNCTAPSVPGNNDIIGLDPMFVDFINDEFDVLLGSPAIDNGTDVGVYEDILGNVRPQGQGFDIGAYEQ